MSTGKLCNHSINVSLKINSENDIMLYCDQYEGHEGDHSAMFYHCAQRQDESKIIDNYRLGRISWKKEGYGN